MRNLIVLIRLASSDGRKLSNRSRRGYSPVNIVKIKYSFTSPIGGAGVLARHRCVGTSS